MGAVKHLDSIGLHESVGVQDRDEVIASVDLVADDIGEPAGVDVLDIEEGVDAPTLEGLPHGAGRPPPGRPPVADEDPHGANVRPRSSKDPLPLFEVVRAGLADPRRLGASLVGIRCCGSTTPEAVHARIAAAAPGATGDTAAAASQVTRR